LTRRLRQLAGGGGSGGAAVSSATAIGATLRGNIQANASATGGAAVTPGTASAKSDAKNPGGDILTTASAPGGGVWTSPSASTAAGVGSVSLTPANITAGQAVSNAILTPSGPNIGVGAMSAAYGGQPEQYEATATFDFKPSATETLYLNLLSDQVSGIGSDSLGLEVLINGTTIDIQKSFPSLGDAETFLGADPSLGTFTDGIPVSIEIEILFDYTSGTSGGFAFTYDLAKARLTPTPGIAALDFASPAVPEPSPWAMMILGFAGLGLAGYRRSRKGAAFAA
jgi:hypothetical protein